MATLAVVALLLSAAARGQENPPPEPTPTPKPAEPSVEEMAADTDPTKPVLFSFRNEFYNLRGEPWRNIFLARADKLVMSEAKFPMGARGILLRTDVPLVTLDDGQDSTTGLGDVYGQALQILRPKKQFFIAYGTGLVLPTATDDSLGSGKWILAPALAPVWFFPKKGFAFLKFQDFVSFAGDSDRRDVHYLLVTTTLLWRVSKRGWMLADAESNTNWERDNATWYKAGLLAGWMVSARAGVSLKVEVPFGDERPSDLIVKLFFFRTKF